MEFFVDGAVRMHTENGKLQNLSYWSYKVLTRSFLESYQQPQTNFQGNPSNNFIKGKGYVDYCTWHRYADFEWLAEHIQREFPGILFPPIPPKEADATMDKLNELLSVGKENENCSKHNLLVEERTHRFQLTFNAIAQITEIHESPILRNFLTLDETDWVSFRENHSKETKIPIMKSVKSKGLKLFAKIKSIGESKDKALMSNPLGAAHALQKEMGHLLRTCHSQLERIVKYSTAEIYQWSDFDELRKPLQGSKLPWTMCFIGNFVRHAEYPEKQGVVRNVDIKGNVAWVEWNDKEGEVDKVSLQQLNCPSSGISDPAVFAIQELVGHIESYCMYQSRSPQTEALKKLESTLWFISRYAKCCMKTIERLSETEQEAQSLMNSSKKKASSSQQERLEFLQNTLFRATSRFTKQYNEFYCPYISKILGEVSRNFGEVSSKLMCDDEWGTRLARANESLTLRFDFSPHVTPDNSKESPNFHVDPMTLIKEQNAGTRNQDLY